MPILVDGTTPHPPQVVVHGSLAVELDWAIGAASNPSFRCDHTVLSRVYEDQPRLAERVRTFWAPSEQISCGGSVELMVLAHHGGLLSSTDADELLGAIEELAADAPLGLPLRSESGSDRAAIHARLRKLRSSPEVRSRWATLARDVWAAVEKDWDAKGRVAVAEAVATRREANRRGASWRDVGNTNVCSKDTLNSLVEALGPGGRITVVPAYFTHLGVFLDLPGTVLLGVKAEGTSEQARARTEALARRLKTLSDPTRLAILEALQWQPLTVSEVANHFSLAQPTVSTHVKLLREAGLVATRSEDGQRKLVVQRGVLEDLLEHLGMVFGAPEHREHHNPSSP